MLDDKNIRDVKVGDMVIAGVDDVSVVIGPLVYQSEYINGDKICREYKIQIKQDRYMDVVDDELWMIMKVQEFFHHKDEEPKAVDYMSYIDDYYRNISNRWEMYYGR